MAYETEAEWKAAQPDLTKITNPMEQRVALESWQMQRPGYVNPMDYKTYDEYAVAANPRNKEFGTDSGAELQNKANFYGMTIENYQNALSGDPTRPMGGNQAVYGSQLLSPLEQRAAEVARGQGISTMSPETLALAKANPEVFNAASQRFQNYLTTTYPGTLEYESVLSGPMQFSPAGVKYPKIDDTASMYILDPRTKQYVKNPNYRGAKKAADGGLMSLTDSPRQSGLHQFAEQVASQGRGDDSLLVHMTPDEVQRLQKFAEANGRSLTINPTTGLPEAGMLSDLFKAIAPIALGAFLGPAGMGLTFGGLSSAMSAGIATGGITALATGSLSRGLMAGLGAYGGAGLGESLMGASGMTGGAALGAGMPADMGFNLADAGVESMANVDATSKAIAQAQPSAFDKVAAGAKAVTASPGAAMDFAKQNFGNLTAAAAPIMAGAMVPTTTKLPEPRDSGLIRQMAFNINPDTGRPDPLYGMREMTPVKASEFGNKTFQGQRDLFYQQNPNPYELGVGSLNQPPRMAGGGIVALAGGGDYTTLTKDSSAEDIASAYKQFTTASGGDTAANQKAAVDYLTNLGIGQDKIGQAYGTYQASPTYNAYTDEQIGSYFQTNPNANIAADIVKFNADPNQVNRYISNIAAPFVGSTDTTGGSGTFGIYNQMNALGIDANELYAARIAADPKYAGWSKEDIARGYSLDKGALALAAADKDGVSDKEWAAFMDANGYSVNDMAQAFGLSKNEVQRRYDAAKKVEKKTLNCPAGYQPNAAGTACELIPITNPPPDPFVNVTPTGFYGNNTGNPLTSTPGDITRNADGTSTVQPNIPGRPYGGFTGMGQVRDAYTAGGGSLGYTAPVPKTPAEHKAAYNTMTDDSLDAYNFLMGKGKNLTQRKAETRNRPVMQRYDEAILGRKIPKLTKPGTTTTKTDTKETVAGNTAVVSGVTFDLTDPTQAPAEDNNGPWSWDVVNKRWVQYGKFADGGMTGYAMGGGLGSLGSYSDGGRLLRGPGDGVSDSIPATIGAKNQPARLADGEFVIPARIVSELGNGSTDAGAKKLYAMMDRVQRARGKTTGKNKVAANSRADKYLPA